MLLQNLVVEFQTCIIYSVICIEGVVRMSYDDGRTNIVRFLCFCLNSMSGVMPRTTSSCLVRHDGCSANCLNTCTLQIRRGNSRQRSVIILIFVWSFKRKSSQRYIRIYHNYYINATREIVRFRKNHITYMQTRVRITEH